MEVSSNDMTEVEIAIARACSSSSGWRVDENHYGYVNAGWLDRYRAGVRAKDEVGQ